MATDVPILVPRRADNGHRDMLWEYARTKWDGWTVVEGHHDDGLFSRSAAINAAAREAGSWEVAVIADSDIVLESPDNARKASEKASATGKMVYAHNRNNMLPWDATQRVIDGEKPSPQIAEQSVHNTWSSCLAIGRELWERVGGFDERFYGWGWDDLAFMSVCTALGGVDRIVGEVFHLWHPRTREWQEGNPHYVENEQLGRRFMDARNDRAAVEYLLSERP